ncbi:putative ABC peptide transporter, substrate-binding component [Streptomyces himastatinicus ATCC 53653]|uniref:Putative ABC peptide transporter, substrate-binding component n=1 Tax=Streptomyces himastatinicus ATCC 53653 TaxID=457427 RepID=D9WSL9_9ACTN|nr:ABC transporter substrate-binding protein [Streptomyces himastatinicus]EFL22160.1 putative ABC peptide transporter, substrate-binding component [Streptomyces himastatinicus ATCC 53653]
MSSRTPAWRTRLIAAAASVALLTTAACSAATDSGPGGGKDTAAGPVRDGGTLTVAQASDADPGSFLKTSVGNILSEYTVLETLTLMDAKTGKPKGVLAKSWKLAPDAKSIDITLRDDVTFHSGRKLTARDVIFTLKKVRDPATGAAGQAIAQQITSMKAEGDHELKLTFSKPTPNVFDLFETAPILNPATYDDYAAGKNVDGTGRFVWKSWTPGGRIALTKYAKYRDAKNTHLDKINIQVINDPTAIVSAIRSGRVQYGVGAAALDARSLSKQPGYALLSSGGSAIPFSMDVTKAPFDKKEVRQAVQYAIDRRRIVQQVEGGHADATSLPWKKNAVGYDAGQAKHYGYQPDKAKKLLAKAGVKGATFKVVTLNTPEATSIFQIVKNNLAAVGLNAKPEVLSATEYDGRIAKRDMGAPAVQMMNSNALLPASAVTSRPEFVPNDNLLHVKSPAYTKLVKNVSDASTPAAQKKALHAYNAYFLDQAFAVPLITRPTLTVRSTSVGGIAPTQTGFLNLGQAWLSEPKG